MTNELEKRLRYWQFPEDHNVTKKITKGNMLAHLDDFLDNYTRGLLTYKIEFI